jgi:hypothetical protein
MKEVDINLNDDVNEINTDSNMSREERIDSIVENHKLPFAEDSIKAISGMLFTISNMYPEYEQDIKKIYGDIQLNCMMNIPETVGKPVEGGEKELSLMHKAFPGDAEKIEFRFSGPKSKRIIAGHLVDIEDLIKKIKNTYSDKNKENYGTTKLEQLNMIEKLVKFTKTDDCQRATATTPLFTQKNIASYTTMPTSFYLDNKNSTNNKKVFIEDNARYDKMMKDYPFFLQAKEANDFIIDKYAPYNRKAEKNELTPKDAK